MKKRIAILISGNGTNMEAIIKNVQSGVLRGVCEVICVVSNNPSAAGLVKAEFLRIPSFCVPSKGRTRERFEEELIKVLKPYQLDYVVLAGFMRVLTPFFITTFKEKIINIHPADTTAYQGPDGYLWAYENGLRETCITVHYVDEGVDTGPVIARRKVSLEGVKSSNEVKERGLAVENIFYSEALYELLAGEKLRSSLCVVS